MALFRRLGSALRLTSARSTLQEQLGFGEVLPALYQLRRGMSGNKIFVGGLSWGVDENSLRSAFEPYGEIMDVVVITDRETGRSKGFGFVEFTSDSAAATAMAQMDGKDLGGRFINVKYATARGSTSPRGGFGGGYGGGYGGAGGGGYVGGGGYDRGQY